MKRNEFMKEMKEIYRIQSIKDILILNEIIKDYDESELKIIYLNNYAYTEENKALPKINELIDYLLI